jgi:N-acetylneuraminate lyase
MTDKKSDKSPRLTGLIAATYTPMRTDGSLRLEQAPAMVDRLLNDGVSGLYVCGSTGEGMSLTSDERRGVAQAFTTAADGRMPVIIQVGHNSLADARQLAAHAQQIGADAISATCPSYFKVNTAQALVDCMAEVAAGAPDLPFYYYHIPALTGSPIDMVEFLQQAVERIPNLVGLKYTAPTVHDYQSCLLHDDGRFDVLWGVDEMLLSALVIGTRGGVGSTYNIAAPLYRAIITAFESGDLAEAARLQALSVELVRTLCKYPFHSAMKAVLKMLGNDVGVCRLPHPLLSADDIDALRTDLDTVGFFQWGRGET